MVIEGDQALEWCYRQGERSDDEDGNTDDWLQQLGFESGYKKWLKKLVYEDNLKDFRNIGNLLGSGTEKIDVKKTTAVSGEVGDNWAFARLLEEGRSDVIRYLLFAKECQEYSWTPGYWDEERSDQARAEMAALEQRGLSERGLVRDKRLKDRYAFQVIRLAHYRGGYREAIQYFQQLHPEKSTEMYYRILSLYAGALYHTGDGNRAKYYFSVVANNSKYYGNQAIVDFSRIAQSGSGFKKTLSFANDKKEILGIYRLRATTSNSVTLDDLKAIRSIDSASPELQAVMIHQVSLVEKNLLERFLGLKENYPFERYEFDPEKSTNGHRLSSWNQLEIVSLRDIRGFIAETLKGFSVCNRYFWVLAGAYLATIDEDYTAAGEYLQEANRLRGKNKVLFLSLKHDEIRLAHSLLSGQYDLTKNPGVIGDQFQKLYGEKDLGDYWWDGYQPQIYLHRMLKYALKRDGAAGQALLVSNWSGFDLEQYNDKELALMLGELEKQNQDHLGRYIIEKSGLTPGKVAARLGSVQIKNGELGPALQTLTGREIPELNTEYIRVSDPFKVPVNENPEKLVLSEPSRWSKKRFAETMQALIEKVSTETDPGKKALLYLKIGNGWYNISHFGSWWIIADDSWSVYRKKSTYLPLLKMAREAWQKARELSRKGSETGATALYLLALVEQGLSADLESYFWSSEKKPNETERLIWEEVAQDYSSTRFFKEVIDECSYYRLYRP